MKKFLIAASCFSLIAGMTATSVEAAAPQYRQVVKASDTTDISARKKTKKGMANSGMKPDASGQGGSGPGSDQGGTKAGNMSGSGMSGGGMQKKGM
jgi:hypothetical protein